MSDFIEENPELCALVTRRQFVAASSITLLGLVAAACGVGSVTSPLASPVTVNIANYAALAQTGGIVRISESASPIALERTGASSFTAFSLICPHQGTTVNVQGTGTVRFVCPGHGAEFNASGANVGGQATSSLRQYSVSYDATTNAVTISP